MLISYSAKAWAMRFSSITCQTDTRTVLHMRGQTQGRGIGTETGGQVLRSIATPGKGGPSSWGECWGAVGGGGSRKSGVKGQTLLFFSLISFRNRFDLTNYEQGGWCTRFAKAN